MQRRCLTKAMDTIRTAKMRQTNMRDMFGIKEACLKKVSRSQIATHADTSRLHLIWKRFQASLQDLKERVVRPHHSLRPQNAPPRLAERVVDTYSQSPPASTSFMSSVNCSPAAIAAPEIKIKVTYTSWSFSCCSHDSLVWLSFSRLD